MEITANNPARAGQAMSLIFGEQQIYPVYTGAAYDAGCGYTGMDSNSRH
jgi:hypothetical protein